MTVYPVAVMTPPRKSPRSRPDFFKKWLLLHVMREYHPPVEEESAS